MYFDAHTHLNGDELFPHRQKHLEEFIAVGGRGLVNIGVNHTYNVRGIDIAKEVKKDQTSFTKEGGQKDFDQPLFVSATVGLHPGEIGMGHITADNWQEKLDEMESLLQQYPNEIVAIGECGTDIHYPGTEKTLLLQQTVFAAQCSLAQKYNLPVVIHARDSFSQAYEIVQQYPDVTFYFHCRDYGKEEVVTLQSNISKLFISFCCNVQYPKATHIRESLQVVDQKILLLETDAPYLAPQSKRGQMNVPAYIADQYAFVADFLDISVDTLTSQIQTNFSRLYCQ